MHTSYRRDFVIQFIKVLTAYPDRLGLHPNPTLSTKDIK